MRSSPQDVVLWAHTVQALGIGGWESCGGALTSPASSAVCKGKIPDGKAEVFHMTKTIICLHPLLSSNLSDREFLPFYCCQGSQKSKMKKVYGESQLM